MDYFDNWIDNNSGSGDYETPEDAGDAPFIRTARIDPECEIPDEFPFDLPLIKNMGLIKFHPAVTFIAGENGSGKSTLMEAIAMAMKFNPEGGSENFYFHTYESHSYLSDYLELDRGLERPQNGFFLRAESFYNVASEIERIGPWLLDSYGGKSLHQQSHGESFKALVMHRFGYNGIYILDEPESALSAKSEIEILSRLHHLVKNNCQFIIATHSPILLSYPRAKIYECQDGQLNVVNYEDSQAYQNTKEYLDNYQDILKHILKGH